MQLPSKRTVSAMQSSRRQEDLHQVFKEDGLRKGALREVGAATGDYSCQVGSQVTMQASTDTIFVFYMYPDFLVIARYETLCYGGLAIACKQTLTGHNFFQTCPINLKLQVST